MVRQLDGQQFFQGAQLVVQRLQPFPRLVVRLGERFAAFLLQLGGQSFRAQHEALPLFVVGRLGLERVNAGNDDSGSTDGSRDFEFLRHDVFSVFLVVVQSGVVPENAFEIRLANLAVSGSKGRCVVPAPGRPITTRAGLVRLGRVFSTLLAARVFLCVGAAGFLPAPVRELKKGVPSVPEPDFSSLLVRLVRVF